ncbi:TolC family protein [Salinicola halimionae]|uniref:TolC family protein n=1 Tax=Salinicola halimionae TaxID=1949081 RepID=UPI000DA182EF|nr:TolC family protein [Salinicola halimionae]
MIRSPLTTLGAAIAATMALSACSSLEPQPYSEAQVRQRAIADQEQMYRNQEPINQPITFYEAAARALKYNLDYRLKLMESALASNLQDVSRHELLPQLVADAGYSDRSNDSGGTSIGIEDGEESLRASTSEERYRTTAGLGLSWSLLDFGLAYYENQQKADQILMAEERRRKVAQNVLRDVRNAYWRALSAQRLIPQLNTLLARTEVALDAARQAQNQGLLPRQEVLAYQRALLDSTTLLTARRQDLELAQTELAALMSLPPGTQLKLADEPEPDLPPEAVDVEYLETLALQHRPEIMEEWYRKRVNELDLEAAKARLWPNITLSAGVEYDSNDYLYNNNWAQSGVNVSLNLLRLLQYPDLDNAQKTQAEVDDLRRTALSMAVLTQVRVGALRYHLAQEELDYADQSLDVDQDLLAYAKAAASSAIGSELEVIRAESRYLLSEYQREAAYSRAQAAWGRLFNSIGLDVLPETVEQYDIHTLASEIERMMTMHQNEAALTLPAPVRTPSEMNRASQAGEPFPAPSSSRQSDREAPLPERDNAA